MKKVIHMRTKNVCRVFSFLSFGWSLPPRAGRVSSASSSSDMVDAADAERSSLPCRSLMFGSGR